jgi:hypothetical protein
MDLTTQVTGNMDLGSNPPPVRLSKLKALARIGSPTKDFGESMKTKELVCEGVKWVEEFEREGAMRTKDNRPLGQG